MGAATAPITEAMNWFIGEDRVWRFTVLDENDLVPVGMAGWTMSWFLREEPDSETIVLQKPGTVADAVLGYVDVPIARADTLTLAPGRYHHALARTNSGSFWVVSESFAILQYAAAR